MLKLKEFLQQEKQRVETQRAKAQVIQDKKAIQYYNGCLDMIELIGKQIQSRSRQ